MICIYTVVVNLRRWALYVILEDTGEVTVAMRFSLLPPEPFDVMISTMDITAIGQ